MDKATQELEIAYGKKASHTVVMVMPIQVTFDVTDVQKAGQTVTEFEGTLVLAGRSPRESLVESFEAVLTRAGWAVTCPGVPHGDQAFYRDVVVRAVAEGLLKKL